MSERLPAAELRAFARIAARLLADPPARTPGARVQRSRPGVGLEYLDHREYAPGDDLRHVDWRQTARRGHAIVRRFQLESATDWVLCLDASSSMASGGGAKWMLAVRCAIAMGHALLDMGHRVGLLGFAAGIVAVCPPGRGFAHFPRLQRTLDAMAPARTGALSQLGACAPRLAGLPNAFVISDFLAPDRLERDLGLLSVRCAQVHALQVGTARDAALPDAGHVTLVDRETGERRDVLADRALASAAGRARDAMQGALRAYCASAGIAFSASDAGAGWRDALLAHLQAARRS